MDFSEIEALVIACVPAITAIVSIISIFLKIVKDWKSFKEEFKTNTDYKDLRDQLNSSIEENRKLKAVMAKTIEEIGKVKYEDRTDVKNNKDLQV